MSAQNTVRHPVVLAVKVGWAPISRRSLLISFIDAGLAASALIWAFSFRYGLGLFTSDLLPFVLFNAALFGCVFGVAVMVSGLPKRLWCHASVDDLVQLAAVSVFSIFVFYFALFAINRLDDIPRSIPALHWLLVMALTGSARIGARLWFQSQYGKRLQALDKHASVPVALIGTGLRASMFIRTARFNGACPYRPVAVFDRHGGNVNRVIDDVPISGTIDDIDVQLRKLELAGTKPRWLVICEDLPSETIGELIRKAEDAGIRVAKSPQMIRLAQDDDENQSLKLRPIEFEDLLGRSPANLDLAAIRNLLKGKRILVTGAGGSIGSELCRMIAKCKPSNLVILDACEFNLYSIDAELRRDHPKLPISTVLGDIRRRHVMKRHFAHHHPEIVFHAAALKHVPMVETNPLEGIETNVLGTRNVVDSAIESGAAAMIMVSTDKAVSPTSVMGATKRMAEFYCQCNGRSVDRSCRTRLITVRFGNVLGSSGSILPLFQQQIAMGGPLTVTHPEISRYFMTINEAVGLVLQAATCILNSPKLVRGVAVLDMGKPVKIYDLASNIARLSGLEPGKDIEIKSVGLRPGEKLYEELFAPEEMQIPFEADGINMAISTPPDPEELEGRLDVLQVAIQSRDTDLALETLESIVPGYEPMKALAGEDSCVA